MKLTSSNIASNTTLEDPHTALSRKGCHSRGYALLSVMFGLVLIGILVGQFGLMVRTDLTKSNNLLISAQVDATIDAIALRVASGFIAERNEVLWEAGGTTYSWQENAFDIRMTVETDNGANQKTRQDLTTLLIEIIMAHGRSVDDAKTIASDILAISQIPHGQSYYSPSSLGTNRDNDGPRRTQLLSIDGMDDELANSLIHLIPTLAKSPTDAAQWPLQSENTSKTSSDNKITAIPYESKNEITRLTTPNKTQASHLSAIELKIQLQQYGRMVRSESVRVILNGPKEAPVRIIKM